MNITMKGLCWYKPGQTRKTILGVESGWWAETEERRWPHLNFHKAMWVARYLLSAKNYKYTGIQAYLVLLCFVNTVFYKLKVCGNPETSKSTCAFFFQYHLLTLYFIFPIPSIFQTFCLLLSCDHWFTNAKRLQLTESSDDG